jgi:hypothetical protein
VASVACGVLGQSQQYAGGCLRFNNPAAIGQSSACRNQPQLDSLSCAFDELLCTKKPLHPVLSADALFSCHPLRTSTVFFSACSSSLFQHCRHLAAQYTSCSASDSSRLFVCLCVLQDGFVEDPAPVADRANFDYTAYADSNALMGPVSAIYYTAAAAQ